MTTERIKDMDYCIVVSDKKMKGSGLVRDDEVMVIGTRDAPVSKADPYLSRTYVVVVKLGDDGEHCLPDSSNDYKAVLVDPRNLQLMGNNRSTFFSHALAKQFA